MSAESRSYEPDKISQTPPPETSLSTNEPTTNYEASSLDAPLLDSTNSRFKKKDGKIKVPSNNDKIKQKFLQDFKWNNNDIKAYTSIGQEAPDYLGENERKFLSMVDPTRGEVQRSVIKIVRCRAIDYSQEDPKKQSRKEYIYYRERWDGADWRGVPLNPVLHWMGRYTKQFLKPHINPNSGEIDYHELDGPAGKLIYYIPFSKKAVDDIIAKSSNTNREQIRFTIKFESEDCPRGFRMPTRSQFTYEQFTTLKWDDVYKYHTKPHVQQYEDYYKTKSTGNPSLAFNPS